MCGAPVERGGRGRPAVYCAKRCSQAAYHARLAAGRAAEAARCVRAKLHQLGGDLAEACEGAGCSLALVPEPGVACVPGWPVDRGHSLCAMVRLPGATNGD